jgi:hypothetical protein
MAIERREEFKRLMACIEESRKVMQRIFPVKVNVLKPGVTPEPVRFTASGWAEYNEASERRDDCEAALLRLLRNEDG